MITEEQYRGALSRKQEAESVIREYHQQKDAVAKKRMEVGPPFTEEELVYARTQRCPCGHGLAYFKGCRPMDGYWDCSAILKNVQDRTVKHCQKYPFAFYEIKGEQAGATTRGTVVPSPDLERAPDNSATYPTPDPDPS